MVTISHRYEAAMVDTPVPFSRECEHCTLVSHQLNQGETDYEVHSDLPSNVRTDGIGLGTIGSKESEAGFDEVRGSFL
jgi:hypothetical protein